MPYGGYVSKGAKIRNQYNQVPHLTQDTNGKVTDSQLYTTNESQEVSPFPAGDHKAVLLFVDEDHSKLPTLYWLPQLHKRPHKSRYIAYSSTCTTTELTILLTSCRTMIKNHVIKYCTTVYERNGKQIFWSI